MFNNEKQKLKIPNNHSSRTQLASLSFQSPELQAIMKLRHKYQKNIQQIIKVIENLIHSKLPQKCLAHNNNFTLYCEADQKPLCASCMYQNQTHKSHRVNPLNNCGPQLLRDCSKFEKQLDFIVGNMTGLVKHVNDGISKMERQFPHIVYKIQQNYEKLHNFLHERQKQHINQLRFYKQRMRYQHGALSTQLNKIALYIQQKVDQYSKKHEPQILIAKRSIYECLKNSAKIIGEQLNVKQQQTEPKLHFQIFSQIQDYLYLKLPNLFIKDNQKIEKSTIYNRSAKKISASKSKQKISYSPVSNNKKIEAEIEKTIQKPKQAKQVHEYKQSKETKHLKSNTKVDKSPKKSEVKRRTTPIKKKDNEKTPTKRQRSKSNVTLGKNSPQKKQSPKKTSPDKYQSNSKQKRIRSIQSKNRTRTKNQNPKNQLTKNNRQSPSRKER